MSVIDDYLSKLDQTKRPIVENMYSIIRKTVPTATEELSYGMPAFKYKGKGLIAIMANKNFLSLYPFGSIERLGLDLSAYECTTGSIHFSVDTPIPDNLLRKIITARLQQIEADKKDIF